MKINPKSQKGALTLIVLVAMLFLTAFLMSMYIGIANKAQTSAENTKEIAERYNNIGEANTIYDSYFSSSEIIPIYTREHLEKIASGEQITIDEKIYTFASDAYYIIKNDIDLGGYYDEATKTWTAEDEWIPLPLTDNQGNQYTFTGTLDGLGHTISGMYINNSESANQGLFGTLEGTVKNLRIVDGYINGLSSIGPIAGTNNGIITNCYNNAIILALSTDNGKAQVDGIWYDSLQDYINGQPILIEFTINDETYFSPKGMDWKTWCSKEEYNTIEAEYLNESDSVVNNLSNPLLNTDGTEVKGSDFIAEGKAYTWIVEEQTVAVE